MNDHDPPTTESEFERNVRIGVLVVSNLVPLAGVFFWGWSTGEVIFLYWIENVIVGLVNVPKMVLCQGKRSIQSNTWPPTSDEPTTDLGRAAKQKRQQQQPDDPDEPVSEWYWLLNIPLAAFFTVHYGIFTLVHGVFVGSMFLGGNANFGFYFMLSVGALAGHHIFDFFWKFIGQGEFRKYGADVQMFSPYGRIVVLHVSILFGGFLMMALGNPVFGLVLFIVLKILFELGVVFVGFSRAGRASTATD